MYRNAELRATFEASREKRRFLSKPKGPEVPRFIHLTGKTAIPPQPPLQPPVLQAACACHLKARILVYSRADRNVIGVTIIFISYSVLEVSDYNTVFFSFLGPSASC